ncbi:conserved hypothetical protein [Ricinus communis]|uniref:Uncharacterized protein n=1 Tax=Ricinus communis TaxID=3988 RepID=B9S0Q1_RICCO|nr:conserved hypothetical protein [Ricinus communis]
MGNNNVKFLLCLVLVMLSFSRSETRPINHQEKTGDRSLIEITKEVLKESLRRQELIGGFNQSKRRSPGGPDPHHH